ncbi:MAG: radical SAM protein [bacterium]|nr:radical SAM protein [bacterium]MCM1374859.1 radical SAM protein [Muribaculum sp.]
MNKRQSPFLDIYKSCNRGENGQKYSCALEMKTPVCIDVELTNNCNLNCYMCPVGTGAMRREKGFISMETVERICAELAREKDILGVRLIRWGEPTLHPQFIDIIKRFKDTGKKVHFNTNGILITQEQIEKIVAYEIDSVKFSFQGVDRYTYEEMRHGSSWDIIMDRVRMLHEIRGDREFPFIQISTTTTYETDEQIENFKKEMEPYCDSCSVGRTKLSHLEVEKMNLSEEGKQRFLRLLQMESLEKRHLHSCPEVFNKLSVNWDGTVTACTSDYDNEMKLGSIWEYSLAELYHSERLDKIRKEILAERYDEMEPCKNCFEYIKLT